MKVLFTIIGALLAAAFFFFIAALLGTLMGAFGGWVVGLFFSETILAFLAQLGIHGFSMWQIGASLGFVGSFFKSVNQNNTSK